MKILALLLLATPAFAETIEVVPTCVAIDESDVLTEADRADALARLQRALELQDKLVVDIGCEDTITLWHERVADGVIVHLRNALGARKQRVALDADMFATYARVASALYEPPPVAIEAPPAMAPSEASDGTVPATTKAWQLGAGFGVLGDTTASSILVGYRFGSNATVMDIAFRATNGGASERTATALGGKVLSYTRPAAVTSPYWGGGASLASVEDEMGSGRGLELDGAVGVEWNRNERWHYSIEATVGLPFFTVGPDHYPASLAISFGISH